MLWLKKGPHQRLNDSNMVLKSYHICYHETEGYLLLSPHKLRVITEQDDQYIRVLELRFEQITTLNATTRHQVTLVDHEERTHYLITPDDVNAYAIEDDLKRRIAPLDYQQFG
jgi:hypothetical protein